jgi:hypothetical protein
MSFEIDRQTLDKVFVPNSDWGFWFRKEWEALPFIGDVTDQPFYQSISQFESTNGPSTWVVASFSFEEQTVVHACSITLPKNDEDFYPVLEPMGILNVDNILMTDQIGKYGIISYNSDCFVIGAERSQISRLAEILGGKDFLRKQFDEEMQSLSMIPLGEGAILKILPALWKR